jgi:diaminopimelate epimerase
MGPAAYREDEIRTALSTSAGAFDVTILNVGNPQCAVFVENFDFDWRKAGVAIEWHERFPQRTNVSFVKVLNQHTIEVLFWERGAGETMSSGTGSTGAAFAAFLRGMVSSPFEVRTPAGSLHLSLSGDDMMVIGPAEIVSDGKYYGG